MESRNTVFMNLFAKKKQRHKCRELTCGHSDCGSEWDKWRKSHQYKCSIMCKMDSW